jgi:Flp pilus assembly protein protease CpaA
MAYIVPLCILDIELREVNHWYWTPLVLVNLPVMIYMYYTGSYPWWCFLISLIIIGIFAAMTKLGLLNGADFMFLLFISLFWIVNPNPWPHGIQVQFYFYLLVAMLLTAAVLPFANYLRGVKSDNILELMSTYPRGVPFILPISLGFVLSYAVG